MKACYREVYKVLLRTLIQICKNILINDLIYQNQLFNKLSAKFGPFDNIAVDTVSIFSVHDFCILI